MNVNCRYNLNLRDMKANPAGMTENAGFIPTGQTGIPVQLCTLPTASGGAATGVPSKPLPFTTLRIFPATPHNSSAGAFNAHEIYVGKSQSFQADVIFPTYKDATTVITVGGLPVEYKMTNGESMDFRNIWITGTAADGVFFQYW